MILKRISILFFVGLLFLYPVSAFAHAQVTDSFPKKNSTVTSVPEQVWIEFDGNLTEIDGADVNFLEVRDSSGASISTGKTIVDGARIIINLSSRVNPGVVKVAYRVVSEDGHPVEGNFQFNLNIPSPTPQQSVTTTGSSKKIPKPRGDSSSAVPTNSASSNVQEKPVISVHEHKSFLHLHSVHILEAIVFSIAIAFWFIFERIKRRHTR